jgi:hemerythrin
MLFLGMDNIQKPSSKKDYISWSSRYSVGIKEIDDQHKALLDLINNLYHSTTGNEEKHRAHFREVIAQSVSYIKNHFSFEEKYMLATNFPEYQAHNQMHKEFILKVVAADKDFEAGKRLVLVNFLKFLRDWVLSHIAVEDMKYSEYFKRIATKTADGSLSLGAEDTNATG